LNELNEGGGVIYDAEIGFDPSHAERKDLRFYAVLFMDIIKKALEEVGKADQARRYEVMKNTVGLGASLALCDYPFDLVAEVIQGQFKGKRSEVGQLNVRAARLAFDFVKTNFDIEGFPYTLKPGPEPKARILAKGYEIGAIAKLKAGCALQTYYPMSPATSGPGFALMVEGIGFASITEAPGPVLVLYQRGGPSTGLPTRQEQGDLQFALHPAQGDFPHIVTAPGDLRECYQD